MENLYKNNYFFARCKNRFPVIMKLTFLILLLLSAGELFAQEGMVKGTVIDKDGALPGAVITVVGSTRGAVADENGYFEVNNVAYGSKLRVTFIGLQDQEFEYTGQENLLIRMEVKADELDEVTVVAFSKQKKESVLAAVTTIKPGELKVPSSNLTTAFSGRVAGLISYQQSGEPGQDNASFFIRGITSFGAESKKDPLILIDGVELTTDDLARLNTDDIASFSIMKDATATALYGARGANGVILVTTKEGKEGKVSVNVRLESSFSSPTSKIDIADPVTYMQMYNEAVKTRDPGANDIYTQEKIRMTESGLYPDIYPANDWYNTMFNDVSFNQRANLSISGGGTVARYYVAANISQDNGNLKIDPKNNFNTNINLTKYALRSNVNVNVTKTTELIMRLSATFDEYTGPLDGGSTMYRKVMQANPVLFKPYYEPDEQNAYVEHVLFGNYGTREPYLNPYAESLKGYKEYSKNLMLSQFELKQDLSMLVEGLKARALINMNRYSEYTSRRAYKPYYYNIDEYNLADNSYTLRLLNPADGTNYITYERDGGPTINTVFYMEAAAEYNKVIAKKHRLDALLVYILRQETNGLENDLYKALPNRNLGLSGRLAYNYDSRYFAEFNFGYNGSERFSKKKRWGFFPSAGLAWIASNEAFFEPARDYFSVLKFKATYGMVGNDAIGSNNDRFYYLAQVNMGADKPVNWGLDMNYNPSGIEVTRYANDEIGWETAYKTNLGLEVAMRNGFSANIDFYHEKRTNILLDRIIPSTLGMNVAVKANLGEAQGQGIDMELNYEKFINKDLWITGRGTFTYATSEVLKWEESDYSAYPWKSRVGQSINQEWGYIAERLFLDDEEVANSPTQSGLVQGGDIKYRDINGDGIISELDMVPIGYPTVPEINYGFGTSVGYKNFDFSFFFQGSARQSFWLQLTGNGRIQPFLDGSFEGDENDGLVGQNAILQAIADSYWSESNQDLYAFWPRLSETAIDNNTKQSTWFMQDATFIRLKSAEIGYTISPKLLHKLHLDNLRVYVSGTNLYCWSVFKLWDPEMAGKGLGYPLQRVFNVGLNIGF